MSQLEGKIDLKLANQVVKMEEQIAAEVERRLKKMNIGEQKVAQVEPVTSVLCEICGGPHFAMHCVATQEQVEHIHMLRQNNPYANTYNPGGKIILIYHGRTNKETSKSKDQTNIKFKVKNNYNNKALRRRNGK